MWPCPLISNTLRPKLHQVNKIMRKQLFVFVVLGALLAGALLYLQIRPEEASEKSTVKLYWFIPDGMRAEPDLFNIYRWAEEGKLPNIKKMMARGSYGYSKPVFPSHTPVNFATLLTGTYPRTHGIADGPMHVEGHALDKVSVGGF